MRIAKIGASIKSDSINAKSNKVWVRFAHDHQSIRKYRTAIFFHGCFWHSHSGCRNATIPSTRREFWQEKFDGNVRRNGWSQVDLEAVGWAVVIAWECELKADAEGVVRCLLRDLRKDG